MPNSKPILLEVIVGSLDDAVAAASGGADRFEMCSALDLGGLTPSLGLLAAVKATVPQPAMFMVRPREGGMAYTDGEYAAMERDAALALEAGADGLVFGFLTPDGAVDVARCRRFLAGARQVAKPATQLVFHRAFDVVADPRIALEQLVDLGITRVLTSGRKANVAHGIDEVCRTVEQSAGRIEVLPGAGISAENVAEIVRRTGVNQVHVALRAPVSDPSMGANPEIAFGTGLPSAETHYSAVSLERVREIRARLDAL